jgi:FixJ family two-component response regulator
MHPHPTIIVVDDDPGMSQATARLLGAAGWQTRTFATAEALLESGAVTSAACLILDINLPGQSGLDLQQHLAATGATTPVIFVTGQDNPAFRDRAARAGCTYLTKPFSGSALIAAIRHQFQAA